ncbi:hypothetical protein HHI36_015397 [Cryptolaemus montrouzieri]
MSLPSGIISEYFGPFRIVLASNILTAIFICVAVLVAGNNWIPLFVCRFFIGLLGGTKLTALMILIANWAPSNEKSTFTSCLLGYGFGSLITPFCGSIIIETMNWQWSFYGTAVATVVFLVAWIILVADHPIESWFCSTEEAEFIERSQEGAVRKGWIKPPVIKMMTSIPFISSILGNFGAMSGLFLSVTLFPKFLREALKFDLQTIGLIAPLPSVSRISMGIVYAAFVHMALNRWNVKKKYIRKGFVICSHIIPGIVFLLYLINLVTIFGNVLAVWLTVLSCFFMGGSIVTTLVNPQDLAPNFAGTQTGILTFFGAMPGFILPAISSKITEECSELPEWAIIFAIVGCIYLVTGITFIVFGSAELQPWNEKKDERQEQITI